MKYKQKHPETCLAKCLMILLEKLKGTKLKYEKELEILIYALKHGKENIAKGHLEKIAKDYGTDFEWIVDSKIFYDVAKKNLPKRITLKQKRIDLKTMEEMMPLITYVDRFELWQKKDGLYYRYHYPHFIIVNRKIGKDYEIIDPDDGKIKKIKAQKLSRAINSLKNKLWISPQIIKLN